MKRLLTLMLAAVMLLCVIPMATAEEVTTVTFWSLFTGADGEQMMKILEAFNAQDPTKQVVQATQDWDNYYTKLKTSIAGGEAADLAISHDVNVWGMIKDGYLISISDEAERIGYDKIDYPNYANKIEDLKYEDSYYAIPLDAGQTHWSYNKEVLGKAGLLDENGLPILEPGLDNFIEFVQKVADACPEGMAPFVFPIMNGSMPWYFFNSLYYQYGGQGTFINDEGTEWTMDKEVGLTALEAFQTIYQLGLRDVENWTDALDSGAVAMCFGGSWQMNLMRQNMIGGPENFGVCKIPQFGDTYASAMYSHTFVLPYSETRTDAQLEVALEFITFFAENNAMWSEAGSVPAYIPSWESDLFKSFPCHEYFKDCVDYATPLTYTGPFGLKGSTECNEPLRMLGNGELTPEQCYNELADRLTTALR